jgi:hypothetical protein
MEKSIYGLMQMRSYYESIWLEGGIAKWLEISHIKFQQNLWIV